MLTHFTTLENKSFIIDALLSCMLSLQKACDEIATKKNIWVIEQNFNNNNDADNNDNNANNNDSYANNNDNDSSNNDNDAKNANDTNCDLYVYVCHH